MKRSLHLFAGLLIMCAAGVDVIRRVHGSTLATPALIVFGDSTVDVGNNNKLNTLAKCNHPPYGRDFPHQKPTGRFCNGLLVTDYLASMLGLMSPTLGYLNPEATGDMIVTGVSFASSASGFYDGTAKALVRNRSRDQPAKNVLTLGEQLKLYKKYQEDLNGVVGSVNASDIISNALHLISTGSNDYLQNYYFNVFLRVEYNRQQFTDHLLNILDTFMKELQLLGARRFAVVSLPPLGCIPSQITLHGLGKAQCVEHLNQAAIIFNKELKKMLHAKNQMEGGRLIAYLDSYTLLLDAAKNPIKYGFNEARRGCCGTGLLEASIFCNEFSRGTCLNASKYVFWDSFHPSERMNEFLAKSLIKQVTHQLVSHETFVI